MIVNSGWQKVDEFERKWFLPAMVIVIAVGVVSVLVFWQLAGVWVSEFAEWIDRM